MIAHLLLVSLSLILFLIAYLLLKLLLIPYIKYRQYRKIPGVCGSFFPIMDIASFSQKDVDEKYDGFAYYKELARKEPNVRARVGNIGLGIMLEPLEPRLFK